MRKFTKTTMISLAVSLVLTSGSALAKITAEEAKKLGNELTPMGAEQKANADGSIPEWTGGITKAPEGYVVGQHHVDPFAADKSLFTITSKNLNDYKGNLTPGQIKLFETYPDTYSMNVYQTRRSASFPTHVYDAVKENSTRAELVEEGNGITQASVGIPFPIPETGLEAIWNHILRYRGEQVKREGGQVSPTASGDYTYLGFEESLILPYNVQGAKPETLQETP